MKKILISGLGGSLFPYLHEQIKAKYLPFYVDSNSIVKRLYSNLSVTIAPPVGAPAYRELVSQLIQRNQIDFYLPLIDEEILLAHEVAGDIPGLRVLAPQKEFAALCLDKFKLMKVLSEKGLSQIESWMGDGFKWDKQSAIFVKPVHGRGSRGARLLHSAKELEAYYLLERYTPQETLIQEPIKGQEYTVGLTTNSLDKILAITPKRVVSKKGITIEAVVDNNPAILSLCERINDVFRPKGAINIQLFEDEKKNLRIFEINPRFSTTSIMSFHAGIDEIDLLTEKWELASSHKYLTARDGIRLIRRWENLFYEN